ncbi:hypothetical protein BST81_24815 [Leptolyngbya sp. 'hensonii']|uniref:DUF192 domain-containing protein n=1 Tax=Leptolyngbya sp. 'hensonii' TaxID=1922337 RepID=UPI00095019EC|nr:DUF192 domain-containing protein [Leptolyngbya sp. 'hensonii']OLP15744.1 hypothetical protein BST81_24815 [Leptolyngbya sp. 'hensonii']
MLQVFSAGLVALLVACSAPTSGVESPPGSESSTSPAPSPAQEITLNQGQSLPITARITIAGQTIDLEVARTFQEQATGLMFRTTLADNRGMLFPFHPPRSVSFWMKNTLIPLDMVFLRQGRVQFISQNVPPCQADPCPAYGPDRNLEIDQVIELRAGRTQELGLKVGDRLPVQFLKK